MKKFIYLFFFSMLFAVLSCSSNKSASNNSDPLVIINGNVLELYEGHDFNFKEAGTQEYAELLNISPDLIEKIEVLKDHSACAEYGERGANGVVLITTMKKIIPPPPTMKEVSPVLEIIETKNIDTTFIQKMEQKYTECYLATGFTEDLVNEILASDLKNNPESEIYFNALYNKYSKEPTYDITKSLAFRALRLKKYDIAIRAYNLLFDMSEFKNESIHEQTFQYCLAAQLMIQAGQRSKILSYIESALKVNPESSDAYMLYATYFGGLHVQDKLPIYCLSYEYSQKALNLCNKNEGNPEIKVIYSKEAINKQIGTYYNILKEHYVSEIFSMGGAGTKLSPIKVGGRVFTPVIPKL